MSNEKKTKQLGIPYGTACARLRKMVLFSLVRELKRDKCYRCGLPILNIAEFTIEHKEPWFNGSADLFWDLGNIAFSHSTCNLRAVRRATGRGVKGGQQCGTTSGYRYGCRCTGCREAVNAYERARRRKKAS